MRTEKQIAINMQKYLICRRDIGDTIKKTSDFTAHGTGGQCFFSKF